MPPKYNLLSGIKANNYYRNKNNRFDERGANIWKKKLGWKECVYFLFGFVVRTGLSWIRLGLKEKDKFLFYSYYALFLFLYKYSLLWTYSFLLWRQIVWCPFLALFFWVRWGQNLGQIILSGLRMNRNLILFSSVAVYKNSD